jgi:endothelin-converting enzyme/putative endopeptidase
MVRNVKVFSALTAVVLALSAGDAQAVLATRGGVDMTALDPAVGACENFYRHACGGFIASARPTVEQPEIRMADARFDANLEAALARLFEEPGGDPELARLKTFYKSCTASMAGADAADVAEVRAWLGRIDAIGSRAEVQPMLRDLSGIGVDVFYNYGGWPDRANWGRYRGELINGGGYSDPPVVERALVLSGMDEATARREAAAVADIAAGLRPHRVQRWDEGTEHPMSPTQIKAAYPGIDWAPYFDLVGAPDDRPINVASPAYFAALQTVLAERPLEDLKAYMRWRFLLSLRGELPAPLSRAFADIDPALRVAVGDPVHQCRDAAVRAMGVEFSRQFSHRILGQQGRRAGGQVAQTIRASMVEAVGGADWLSPQARAATADKLRRTDLKIGYPEQWPRTGNYPLAPDRFMDNVLAARRYEQRRTWARALTVRDRRAWDMIVSPWVGDGMAAARLSVPNGFPDAFSNSLIMTAAYLVPPRFDANLPVEANYGTFGAVFGHELVHVAQLHMFTADGRDGELWTEADAAASKRQGQCVIDQANAFHPLPDLTMDGEAQYEENVADYGGVRLAYEALRQRLGKAVDRPDAEGMTPARRFFYAYAQNWCTAQTEASLRGHVASDGHGPPEFRVNGPLSNLPGFAEAFGCDASSPMVRPAANRCVVW